MKRILMLLTAVCLTSLLTAQQGPRLRTTPWPEEVLTAFAHLPIQEGGRIKPLDTFAQFELLTFYGKRSFKYEWQENGEDKSESLSAVAWMLDCLFYPEQAWNYQMVVVDDIQVVRAIGLAAEGKTRRDRYSLTELEPAFGRLGELGQQLSEKDSKERSGLERQILHLASKLPRLRHLVGHLDFARETYDLKELGALKSAFPNRSTVPFLDLVVDFDKVREPMRNAPELEGLGNSVALTVRFANYLKFLPPLDPNDEVYIAPESVLMDKFQTGLVEASQWDVLKQLESLVAVRDDFGKLCPGIVTFCEGMSQRAASRGENAKVAMEVEFYKADWFFKSIIWCLIGFVVSTGTWFLFGWNRSVSAGRRKIHRLVFWSAMVPTLYGEYLIIAGIVTRCILRDRPPVTTPYEAVLFCVACAVLLLLFTEIFYRNGLAVSGAALFGALGMRVAVWQESADAVDTMQPLVAVLDTNFWLSTHVTMVTLGYMAAWVAAFIAQFYILFKFLGLFGIWDKTKLCHYVSRAIYGVMCFGLVFSLGGTILGGVWANDSWGRFWGWDPKENGALMLVLVFLFVLHARMGGYLREFGIALGAIVAGITSFWAFWGVNLLQIGLHSYGFDEQKALAWELVRWFGWASFLTGVTVWGLHRLKAARSAGS
jgi:ABC-type transport system involved in cytochrome c biogenesis permease subunit